MNLSLETAEELCRLFPVDTDIDLTRILRSSKESARRLRAKPASERQKAVPTTRPLSMANSRPMPPRGGPYHPGMMRGGGGGMIRSLPFLF